ncbi:hypothetical protein BsWGS_23273 [Bradybaena similaris]
MAGAGNPKEGRVGNPKGRVENPKGRVGNPKGRVGNPKGRVGNPKGRVGNPKGRVRNPKGRVGNPKEGGSWESQRRQELGILKKAELGILKKAEMGILKNDEMGIIKKVEMGILTKAELGILKKAELRILKKAMVGTKRDELCPNLPSSEQELHQLEILVLRLLSQPGSNVPSPQGEDQAAELTCFTPHTEGPTDQGKLGCVCDVVTRKGSSPQVE